MKNSIKRLREEKGLNLRQLGEMSGVPHQSIWNYEKSESPLPNDIAERLSKALGTSVDDIRTPPETFLRDSPVQYTIDCIKLSPLPDKLLLIMWSSLWASLPKADAPQRGELLSALSVIDNELKRRGLQLPGVTESAADVALGSQETARHIAQHENREYLRSGKAEEPTGNKPEPARGARPVTKDKSANE